MRAIAIFVCWIGLLGIQPALADNPAKALSDAQVILVQQAGLGCPEAFEALRRNSPALASACAAPVLSLEVARPLAEAGRMNGMMRGCNITVWDSHKSDVFTWARAHGAADDEHVRLAIYNAGHVLGTMTVIDGRNATACVEGRDFSIHYYQNNIAPLIRR